MGHKIFVSYKYADTNVANVNNEINSTVRSYVDILEEKLDDSTHIYKGESDGEDLSQLEESTIWSKLKDRIRDSTLTIVMISPNMKDPWKQEKNQWIPQEISYSLKEVSRKNKNGDPVTSKTNALLAIVLPDSNNSYNYYTYHNTCCDSKCRVLQTDKLFKIMKNNMFNIKAPDNKMCTTGSTIWYGQSSYMQSVTWEDFISDMNSYIDMAYEIRENIDSYNICKEI